MGNRNSLPSDQEDEYQEKLWWAEKIPKEATTAQIGTEHLPQQRNREDLDEFKLELARKHEKRRQLIADKQRDMMNLREEIQRLQSENEELKKVQPEDQRKLREENEELKRQVEEQKQKNLELKMTVADVQQDIQGLNTEAVNFEKERQEYQTHVRALKDVIAVSKQMLTIRETQLTELKQKVSEIEASLSGKELTVLSQDLRTEYERQLQNIRNLRIYYEERQRADAREKEDLKDLLDETKRELEIAQRKNSEHQENIDRLENENSQKYDEIKSLESNLGLAKAESRQYQAELSVINQLFSQILVDSSQDFDVDKLIRLLEENHNILQDIAINEGSNEVAALPKVLLDLVTEVHDNKADPQEESPKKDTEPQLHQLSSASEIVQNLPKVWKVLIELLSHQCVPTNDLNTEEHHCYKLVQTPKGSHFAPSVSKTFIRLKDLILEKKSLERETGRLKQLNTHLECRLQEQEKRLGMVSNELSETWNVVGKLQKKHQLLHTQEKILRYELAQKRKLLTELKEELEYSREKWLEAREKNSNTARQWEELRLEFASRKIAAGDESVESGYSDGRECSSEDEPEEECKISKESIVEVIHNQIEAIENEKVKEISSVSSKDSISLTDVEIVVKEEDEVMKEDEIKKEEEKFEKDEEETEKAEKEEDEIGNSMDHQRLSSENKVHKDEICEEDGACCLEVSGHKLEEVKSTGSVEEKNKESRTLEEVLSAREQRLLRLEAQTSGLMKQVGNTTNRSEAISNKLDVLHEIYGESSSRSAEDGDDAGSETDK